MKKTVKSVLAFCAMMTMSMAAFAQNSNSFNATAGTIRNDVNYSMDPRYYMDAEFNDLLAYVNVNTDKGKELLDNSYKGYLDLGFAKNIGKFYLGASYYGDLWGNATGSITEKTVLKGNAVIETITDKNRNDFNILFGFMDIGAEFMCSLKPESTKTTTTVNTPATPITKAESETTETINSETKFDIGGSFGASLKLSPFTLKPYAYFGGQNLSTANGSKAGKFVMNLGSDFVFGGNSATHTAGLMYGLDAGAASDTVKHPVNTVDLYYLGNFKLGSKGQIGTKINVSNKFDSEKKYNSNGECISNVFKYNLDSNAAIGVKYHTSDSFAFNAGINMTLPNVSVKTWPDSAVNTYESSSNCDFVSTVYSGGELDLGKNWMLDMSVSFDLGNVGESLFNAMRFGVSYRK